MQRESSSEEESYDEDDYTPVAPPSGRLIVKREGRGITRKIPKPIVLVNTREQIPFEFTNHSNWIADTKRQKFGAGDYSVVGMDNLLALERKTLTDLITTLMQHRKRFFKLCEKLAKYRWRALLIEATYEDIKSPYYDLNTQDHSNAISGSLDALEARFGIPAIYTLRNYSLAEEKAAGWLSRHFTYLYLESNGYGRVLQEGDL